VFLIFFCSIYQVAHALRHRICTQLLRSELMMQSAGEIVYVPCNHPQFRCVPDEMNLVLELQRVFGHDAVVVFNSSSPNITELVNDTDRNTYSFDLLF
jgi:hypothetical protein